MLSSVFHVVLIIAAFLCSLVAGFLFAFAVVVMAGIGRLPDAAFLRAFQVIDGVVQNNQLLFVLVWVGSLLAAIAAAALGFWATSGPDRVLIVAAALVYIVGVQLPTFAVNIPLNNRIQRLDVAAMNDAARLETREAFERRWNQWNILRTLVAMIVTLLLLIVLLRA